MGDIEYVDKNICILRHEVQDTKLSSLEKELADNKERTDTCFQLFNDIKDLQMKTLYGIVIMAIMIILILVGVIVGRGVDFGLILAGV